MKLAMLIATGYLTPISVLAQTVTSTTCSALGSHLDCNSTSNETGSPGVAAPVALQVRQFDLGAALLESGQVNEENARAELLREQAAALAQQRALAETQANAQDTAEPPPGFLANAIAACYREFRNDDAGFGKCEDAAIDALVPGRR